MQVKGLMPPKDGISQKSPPAEPLEEIQYNITFPLTKELFMPQALFCLICFIFSGDFHGVV